MIVNKNLGSKIKMAPRYEMKEQAVVEAEKTRKKWEYSYQNIGANVETLNQFGAEGWEIVIIDRSWVLFKREVI